MTTSRYENDQYLQNNQSWHVEDSPWKAAQILTLLTKNQISPNNHRIAEVGCGAGEILAELQRQLPSSCQFWGYDISPQLEKMWESRANDQLTFCCEDFLKTTKKYNYLLLIDIVEHIEDYIGFLRQIKPRATYKVFNFPLEIFAAKALLSSKYHDSRQTYGHIHYFNKQICLDVLRDVGYDVIDAMYAPSAIDLAETSTSISTLSKLAKLPRQILAMINEDLTAKLLGGYSLFIVAR